jgi:diguanylate cyclase (GGDEF)-like protein
MQDGVSEPSPVGDPRRVAVLDDLAIVGTAPELAYDDIASIAAASCGSDIAAVNFVGAESHWTKAVVGVAKGHGATVAADLSLCAATIRAPDGTLSVPDMLADERWHTHPFVAGDPRLRFYAGASIVVAGARVGVVCVFGDRPRAITPRHQDALKALARQAARHLELRRLSLSDPLTGLPNRALLFERLEAALARSRHEGGLVGLVFCDVDDFKRVNDRLGHDAGDRVLCEVGERLRSVCRRGDTVARLAGDEFVLVCPRAGCADDLEGIVRRVHDSIRRAPSQRAQPAPLRLSVGAVLAAGHESPQSALRRADAAMYDAKRAVMASAMATVAHGETLTPS